MKYVLVGFLVLTFFVSCNAGFSDFDDDVPTLMNLERDGLVLQSGSYIHFSIKQEEDSIHDFNTLNIALYDSKHVLLASSIVDAKLFFDLPQTDNEKMQDDSAVPEEGDGSEDPLSLDTMDTPEQPHVSIREQASSHDGIEIQIPDLEDGLYYFEFQMKDKNRVIETKRLMFFVLHKELGVAAINSYPVSLLPMAKGLFVADIHNPYGMNPYLIWRANNRILAEGFLDEGLYELVYESGRFEEIISLNLDVYPYVPEEPITFRSNIQGSADIVVSRKPVFSRNDFVNEESFYHLFHFWGEKNNYGFRTASLKAVDASLDPAVSNGFFGFRLDPTDSLMLDDFFFPVLDGYIQPSSFILLGDMKMHSLGEERVLFESGNNLNWIRLSISDKQILTLHFSNSIKETSTSIRIPDEKLHSFAFSLIPENDSLIVNWYWDNQFLDSGVVENLFFDFSQELVTSVFRGFSGVLDELAVYFQNDLGEPDVFNNFFTGTHVRGTVYLAEGFDSFRLPSSFLIEKQELVSSSQSGLKLEETGAFVIGDFPLTKDYLAIRISGSVDSLMLTARADDEDFKVTLPFSDMHMDRNGFYQVSVFLEEGSLVYRNGDEIIDTGVLTEAQALELGFEWTGEAFVESLLVYSEYPVFAGLTPNLVQ